MCTHVPVGSRMIGVPHHQHAGTQPVAVARSASTSVQRVSAAAYATLPPSLIEIGVRRSLDSAEPTHGEAGLWSATAVPGATSGGAILTPATRVIHGT
jgi:hypothetical protein